MDWKPLLDPAVDWRGRLLTAGQLDARVAEARTRFRTAVDALGRLERAAAGPPADPPATFGAVVAAAFGPGDVAPAWRRWRDANADAPGALEALERGVEDAQRQVSQVALWIDAVDHEATALRAEMEELRRLVACTTGNADLATRRADALRAGLLAVEVAQARARPGEGTALEADAAVLDGLLQARTADARRFEQGASRLGAVLHVGAEALGWCDRLRGSLERVHGEGSEVLDELDLHLGRLAAEARAADMGAALQSGMGALRTSVGRVHLQVREGADQLLHRLDALADAPDLLAPTDPARAAAEREVAELTRRRG